MTCACPSCVDAARYRAENERLRREIASLQRYADELIAYINRAQLPPPFRASRRRPAVRHHDEAEGL